MNEKNENPFESTLVPIIPSTLVGIKFGIGIGIGIAFVWLPLVILLYVLLFNSLNITQIHSPDIEQISVQKHNLSSNEEKVTLNQFGQKSSLFLRIKNIPADFVSYTVSSTAEFFQQFNKLFSTDNKIVFIFASGKYRFHQTISVKNSDIWFISQTGNPNDVIFEGNGMRYVNKVDNLIYVTGKRFYLNGISLQKAGNHLIQIAGEKDADNARIENCILRDGYEQLIKVSYDKINKPNISADNGIVRNCLFEYTAGIGPNYYIGGIDLHAGKNWKIENNTFKNIASPNKHIAEHAIHVWNNTQNPQIIGNYIENCDRGIGLGMLKSSIAQNKKFNIQFSNFGGLVARNFIYHQNNNHPFADTGIILEDSANTVIQGNFILLEHAYKNAIEYRYPSTKGVTISNNITNKRIKSRNGGQAELVGNKISNNKHDYPLIPSN